MSGPEVPGGYIPGETCADAITRLSENRDSAFSAYEAAAAAAAANPENPVLVATATAAEIYFDSQEAKLIARELYCFFNPDTEEWEEGFTPSVTYLPPNDPSRPSLTDYEALAAEPETNEISISTTNYPATNVVTDIDTSADDVDVVTIHLSNHESSGHCSVDSTLDRIATIIMCGGGGGGGFSGGGGGGAAVVASLRTKIPAGSHTFAIGKGGAPGIDNTTEGEKGSNGEATSMHALQSDYPYMGFSVDGGGGGGGQVTTGSTGGGDQYHGTGQPAAVSSTPGHLYYNPSRGHLHPDGEHNIEYFYGEASVTAQTRYPGGTGTYVTQVSNPFGGGGGGCTSAGADGNASGEVAGAGGAGILLHGIHMGYGGNGGSQSNNVASNEHGGFGASKTHPATVATAYGSGGGGGAGHTAEWNYAGSYGSGGFVMIRFDK